jgi:ribosomal protein S10
MIRAEILRISKKDQEARKLEHFESEILKRLRDTHIRQQQAIDEITQIFN